MNPQGAKRISKGREKAGKKSSLGCVKRMNQHPSADHDNSEHQHLDGFVGVTGVEK
jgi:hypothetical protein